IKDNHEATNQSNACAHTAIADARLGLMRRDERPEDDCTDRALHFRGLLELSAGGQTAGPIPFARPGPGRADLSACGLLGQSGLEGAIRPAAVLGAPELARSLQRSQDRLHASFLRLGDRSS